jgi:acetoin utilization deacetylase AcuC-like enzyme
MLPFKLVYSEKYFLPIGEHIFRADKFRLIRERLLQQGIAADSDFVVPQQASEADVLLVHSPLYVNKLMEGSLSAREELEMEIPYSPQVVDAFMLHTGGSILAAERALEDGVGINMGGGFHHAFPEHGEGFCMINDFAVAIRAMQKRGKIRRAMTVDCDASGEQLSLRQAPIFHRRQPARWLRRCRISGLARQRSEFRFAAV